MQSSVFHFWNSCLPCTSLLGLFMSICRLFGSTLECSWLYTCWSRFSRFRPRGSRYEDNTNTCWLNYAMSRHVLRKKTNVYSLLRIIFSFRKWLPQDQELGIMSFKTRFYTLILSGLYFCDAKHCFVKLSLVLADDSSPNGHLYFSYRVRVLDQPHPRNQLCTGIYNAIIQY